MSLPASWFHWDGNGQEVICWQFVTALWIECGGDSSVNISSHWHHWSRCCPPEQLLWAILEGMKNENTSSVAQVCSWLRDTTRRQTPSNYFSAEPTSQKPKRPSVSDCKCYIMPGPVSWSNQGVFWGMYQEETSVVVRECCLLFSPDFNHLPKFVQEFTKCSLSYTHKHILGPSAHNPLWPSKSLNCSAHTHHTAREEFLALFLSAGGIPSGPEGKSRGIWPDGGDAQV